MIESRVRLSLADPLLFGAGAGLIAELGQVGGPTHMEGPRSGELIRLRHGSGRVQEAQRLPRPPHPTLFPTGERGFTLLTLASARREGRVRGNSGELSR